ncbi:hypothetical protein M8C21_018587 [Ambrosia artemisiifolia]|uniref:Uncharacterized protein n=1 Tax=Ambrosia artemisiifolia TaxID=4212 RepID=A0AAD5CQ03_AMBAR|nr:hypothetical protein M8C21_018587 [Ambrosia artemisiifolia]
MIYGNLIANEYHKYANRNGCLSDHKKAILEVPRLKNIYGGKVANHIIVLLWLLTAACIKVGRPQIARRAIEVAELRLAKDGWPEYYDGKSGRYIGKQAHKHQTGLLRVIWWLK